MSRIEQIVFAPLRKTGKEFWILLTVLIALTAWGLFAYIYQLSEGLGVTGLNRPVFWGVYLANYVFFIGISNAGTLISAILRITHANWRRPITRIAEAITAFALILGGLQILIDMGRPDRVLNLIFFGRFQSPFVWDFIFIGIYLLSSVVYLYLPMLPDFAHMRDTLNDVAPWRRWLYRTLALGWRGTREQHRRLEKSISVMAVVVIPIAVLMHTVVSWIFSTTVQPMWHSTILGPYFVVGAIFSGIATLFLAMAIMRKALHLQEWLAEKQFDYLGILMLVLSALWTYFTLAEYVTTFYGALADEMPVADAKLFGEFNWIFWLMVLFNGIIPLAVLIRRAGRTVKGTVVVSIFVVIGMWLERFTIVAPSLTKPRFSQWAIYQPTWVEASITLGSVALFALLFVVFFKLFPSLSIWEIEEGVEIEERRKLAENIKLEDLRAASGAVSE